MLSGSYQVYDVTLLSKKREEIQCGMRETIIGGITEKFLLPHLA